jgi:hypothetical protein
VVLGALAGVGAEALAGAAPGERHVDALALDLNVVFVPVLDLADQDPL